MKGITGIVGFTILGFAATAQAALIVVESPSAPASAAISQPDFSAAAFNGSQDFTDNAGPPGQTFTPAANLTLKNIVVKGFANTPASFGNFPASFTVTINQVNGTTLTRLDQEMSLPFTPASGSEYLQFTFENPLSLTGGTQYAYDISTTAGYFGFAKSSADVYPGGAAIQAGTVARTSTTGEAITNTQAVDRTFYINAVTPEPASFSLIGIGALGLLARRRRR
jgi:hypothetical protein